MKAAAKRVSGLIARQTIDRPSRERTCPSDQTQQ